MNKYQNLQEEITVNAKAANKKIEDVSAGISKN